MTVKPIDEALMAKMWTSGKSTYIIGAAIGLSRQRVNSRAAMMGLPPRIKALPEPTSKMRSKPVSDPKPKAVPVYQAGLSDAVKRAQGSVQRLGKVATSYRVPYREILAMAGVTA